MVYVTKQQLKDRIKAISEELGIQPEIEGSRSQLEKRLEELEKRAGSVSQTEDSTVDLGGDSGDENELPVTPKLASSIHSRGSQDPQDPQNRSDGLKVSEIPRDDSPGSEDEQPKPRRRKLSYQELEDYSNELKKRLDHEKSLRQPMDGTGIKNHKSGYDKAGKKPAPKTPQFAYYVAQGHAITSARGILGEYDEVRLTDFYSDPASSRKEPKELDKLRAARMNELVSRGIVVRNIGR